MKEFTQILLGEQTPAMFGALVFFAMLGASLSLLLQTTKRDVNSPQTPRHFTWEFFFSDNTKRILGGLLLIYVAIRFTPEIFGVQVNEYWSLVIGFVNDKIAQVLKDKTNLFGQKKI